MTYREWLHNIGLTTGDVLPPGTTRILLAICQLADEGGGITLRRLAAHLGHYGNGGGHYAVILPKLERLGLIEKCPAGGATMRPACRIALFKEFFPTLKSKGPPDHERRDQAEDGPGAAAPAEGPSSGACTQAGPATGPAEGQEAPEATPGDQVCGLPGCRD